MSLERPILAVDVVVMRVEHRRLQVLLHERTEPPFPGAFALPGVAMRADETLLAAARRALRKTGLTSHAIDALFLEQLATFDDLYRDPRGRTVSVAHLALCLPGLTADDPRARWKPVRKLEQSLPFDHELIVSTAIARLRGKLRYTNIAARLLPQRFRIEELQQVYEAILGRTVNRANFRTKLLKIGLIERAGILTDAVGKRGGRPPHLYRFSSHDLEPEDRDFL